MLSEVFGKKKNSARPHHVAVAEQVIELRQLKTALEEQADERWAVMMSLQQANQRLDEIPAAIEACDHARFQALTQHELHPDTHGNREREFADQRAGLLREQETLTGKRTALETERGELERRVKNLKDGVIRTERVIWEAIVAHLAEDVGASCRDKVLVLWSACWQLRDGVAPVAALDIAFDFRSFDDASRIVCLEKLKAEFDVP